MSLSFFNTKETQGLINLPSRWALSGWPLSEQILTTLSFTVKLLPFSHLKIVSQTPSNFTKELFHFKDIWTVHKMARNLAMKIYKVLGRTMCSEIIAQDCTRALSSILSWNFKHKFPPLLRSKPSTRLHLISLDNAYTESCGTQHVCI